jgi:two-component sensor histidine kinase
MNIITSILNLKKHMSESEEVQVAMEECRNRVFSMALVHKRIYQTNNISSINLKDYARELLDELINGMGGEDALELEFQSENIDIDLNKAIPCGLIINELVTNSFKYAKTPGKKLILSLKIKAKDEQIYINIKDNGPGMNEEKKSESLGMLLIESLSEQISGAYTFENKDGLLFRLCFDK